MVSANCWQDDKYPPRLTPVDLAAEKYSHAKQKLLSTPSSGSVHRCRPHPLHLFLPFVEGKGGFRSSEPAPHLRPRSHLVLEFEQRQNDQSGTSLKSILSSPGALQRNRVLEIPAGTHSVQRLEHTTRWANLARDVHMEPLLVVAALCNHALAIRAFLANELLAHWNCRPRPGDAGQYRHVETFASRVDSPPFAGRFPECRPPLHARLLAPNSNTVSFGLSRVADRCVARQKSLPLDWNGSGAITGTLHLSLCGADDGRRNVTKRSMADAFTE